MKKSIYVLGLNEALCASAALLKDGEIIAAAAEERFTRIKNFWGFPKNAIAFCLDFAKIKSSDLELVVLSYIDPFSHFVQGRAQVKESFMPPIFKRLGKVAPGLEYKFPFLNALTDAGRNIYYKLLLPRYQVQQEHEISEILKIPKEKIIRVNHHLCHAYSAYYSNPERSDDRTVVLTNDGAGDMICASIYIVKDGKFRLLAETPYIHSLGLFYAAITSYLGLKAHEDEYKVMGLAPYAENSDYSKIYEVFRKLIWNKELKFDSLIPSRQYGLYLEENLKGFRFDQIATAAQKIFEDLMLKWVQNAINKTRAKRVCYAGGSFLNVKTNMLLDARCKMLDAGCFFMPSPGDDTNAIGATYYGYKFKVHPDQIGTKFKVSIKPLSNLYLGPEYSEKEIVNSFKKFKKIKFEKVKNIETKIAKLLAKGKVVARFAGRMEFGARALGNRSILADPRNKDVVEEINKMIKMRDFWMPFAPTILVESVKKYIIDPKPAPYMILAFDTTETGKQHLAAAIHPYDKTVRPQTLKESDNPSYYKIIKEFERLTRVGAILNTSFNIHGEPIVCTPLDALSTLERSGLEYLVIEKYLVTKK